MASKPEWKKAMSRISTWRAKLELICREKGVAALQRQRLLWIPNPAVFEEISVAEPVFPCSHRQACNQASGHRHNWILGIGHLKWGEKIDPINAAWKSVHMTDQGYIFSLSYFVVFFVWMLFAECFSSMVACSTHLKSLNVKSVLTAVCWCRTEA